MNRKHGKKGHPRRLKAIVPPGFRDRFGDEIRRRDDMLGKISGIFHRYGFDPLETPAIEYLDSLGKFLPDKDRPNEGVFAWKEDESWLSLRYDLTAPLARVVAQHRNSLQTPYRRYAIGPVWRDEKPGPGRFRQFFQCDADTVGTSSVAADAEMCLLVIDILESLGIERGGYRVRINNRKILDGVLEAARIDDGTSENADIEKRGVVLRTIDKLDRLGMDAVIDLLGEGRRDSSGDFTRGAGLTLAQINLIVSFLNIESSTMTCMFDSLRKIVGDSDVGSAGVFELEKMLEFLDANHIGTDRCYADTSVVRGLGYYTGNVMEAELVATGESNTDVRRLGAVAGGGRYDDLVRRFTGHSVPATGMSIGIERLLLALDERQSGQQTHSGPVLVTVMDRHRLTDYQPLVTRLRMDGIRAELYLGNARNFGRQLKYADQRNCPIAVIQGDNELARGVVLLKDLQLGSEISRDASQEEWKARAWQQEVRVEELNEAVRKILDRHSEGS